MTARVKVMLSKIKAVQEYILSGIYEADGASDALTMLGQLYKAIAEEQEPVVRCKVCKHRLECDYWIENGDDWFCADGKRW